MSELIPHVVKDTGAKLLIKRVSPLLVMELRKQFPEPQPPTQVMDVGGETREERNYADPDYAATLQAYSEEQEARIRKLLIKRGVFIPEDNMTWQAEIDQKRADWLADFGKELPRLDEDDRVDWIGYCAIGTDDDYQELYQAILRRTQPTAEAVEAAKAGFPGKV